MWKVNVGKWILRSLFDKLVQEEIKRDASFRKGLTGSDSRPVSLRSDNVPVSIELPPLQTSSSLNVTADDGCDDDSAITPRPSANAVERPAITPGLTIGMATPYINGAKLKGQNETSMKNGEDSDLDNRASEQSHSRNSTDRKSDYFSTPQPQSAPDNQIKESSTPGGSSLEGTTAGVTQSPIDSKEDEKLKEGGSLFGKSFRMKFPKKIGRASTDVKPAIVDEKSEESDRSEEKEERTIQDNFWGIVQRIRRDYEDRLQQGITQRLVSGVNPSPLSETPHLELPAYTLVIIQDERPDSGGVVDLYRGTISSVGIDASQIEKVAPMWLGDLLLKVPLNSV